MSFLNHLDEFQALVSSPVRESALEFIRAQGLPTRQHEDWKYTSLKKLSEKNYSPIAPGQIVFSSTEALKVRALFNKEFVNLVFVNGVLAKDLSEALPAEMTLAEEFLAPRVSFADTLEALSLAYALKNYTLTVKKEFSAAKPVHLIFWTQGELAMGSVVVQINVESRSQAQFIETHTGTNQDYLANSLVELRVASHAKASLVKVQEESLLATYIGRTRVSAQKFSEVEVFTFSTGAQLARHSLEVLMQGEGAAAQAHGVYTVAGSQHVDNDTTIDHQVGHCNTSQLYKGLLDGESRAVFNGKVLIRKDSQKANSEQLNNNLLLSRKAEADSKPMLQIEADDVKASHGSTVGQMDQEELFYLLSRAIPKTKAISMMSYGFLAEVIERLSNETTQVWLKKKLDDAFEKLSTEIL